MQHCKTLKSTVFICHNKVRGQVKTLKREFFKFLAGVALRHAVTWDVTPCNVVTSTDFARNVSPVCLEKKELKYSASS